MSTPSDPVDPSRPCPPEVVLVRTSSIDPAAAFRAASVDPSRGRLVAVLATLPRKRLQRQLLELGRHPENDRIVEFVRGDDSQRRAGREDDGHVHGDLSGLSMDLIGQFDWLKGDEKGVIYLDALEPYVSVAGLESTFRFLVIVAARARANGVTLVARLGPETLDPIPVGTLAEAFDRTVERDSADEREETGETGETEKTKETGGTGEG